MGWAGAAGSQSSDNFLPNSGSEDRKLMKDRGVVREVERKA